MWPFKSKPKHNHCWHNTGYEYTDTYDDGSPVFQHGSYAPYAPKLKLAQYWQQCCLCPERRITYSGLVAEDNSLPPIPPRPLQDPSR